MKYDHYLIDTQGKWEHTWVYRPFPHKRQNFPLLLRMAGYAKWCAGETYERVHSTDFFVEYVCAGNVRFVQNGKEYLIQPGEAYLLRKGASHCYSTGSAGFALKRFVQIAGSGLDYYLRALELWDQDRVRPQHPRSFERLLKQVTTLLAQSPSDSDTSLDVEFSCLMYQLLLELNKAIQPSVPPIIEKALALMHERLHCSLSREEICESVGLSMSYFNKVFSEYMHCTPIAYFLDQKFNWTVQLLKTTSLSVKEIAYKAGFDDPLYFSAQFKKRFGFSPTEYRKHEERMAEQKRRRDYHPCSTPGLR
jgi:AraC-like DNA-binding protein